MQNLLLSSVSPVAFFAVGLVAGFCALLSRLVGWFEKVLPVRLFLRAAGFCVSRSFFAALALAWRTASFFVRLFFAAFLHRSVAVFASNPTLKWDCAKARSPLAPRWAPPQLPYISCSLDRYGYHPHLRLQPSSPLRNTQRTSLFQLHIWLPLG